MRVCLLFNKEIDNSDFHLVFDCIVKWRYFCLTVHVVYIGTSCYELRHSIGVLLIKIHQKGISTINRFSINLLGT